MTYSHQVSGVKMTDRLATIDEEIAGLAIGFNQRLKVQDLSPASPSLPPEQEESSSSNNAEAAALPSAYLVSSPQLALIQFTLSVQPFVTSQQPPPYGNAHVMIHVDGISASASPFRPDGSTVIEVLPLSLISDKVPVETIPLQQVGKDAMFLIKFWADLSFGDGSSEQPNQFHIATTFQSSKLMSISSKTSVCSFGKVIADKVEKLHGEQVAPDKVVYRNVPAPLCDLLVNFIQHVKRLGDIILMNGVLENFSVTQVIFNDMTQEVLLYFVYVFEVCPPELSTQLGAMCRVFLLDARAKAERN